MNDQEFIEFTVDVINKYSTDLEYFKGHIPRFLIGKHFIERYCNISDGFSILDVGTGFPFQVYYLTHEYNIRIVYLDPHKRTPPPKTEFIRGNVCLDTLPIGFDLVICTEVFEHLPCNLYKVKDKLIKSSKKYLLFSFPLKGVNARDYDKDLKLDFRKVHGHLREFTTKTAFEFVKDLKILEHQTVYTPSYGGNILVMLLSKY